MNIPVTQSAAKTPQSPNRITILVIGIVAQKGKKKRGGGERGVMWKMGSEITCTKMRKHKEATQND